MPEGRFRRALRRFTAADDELAAEDLQQLTERLDATSVASCAARERVRVVGMVTTVSLRPRAGVPALEAELYDGTGTVVLVWLGRRRIAGIEPGRQLVVEGRIGQSPGRRVIFNPDYTLLPRPN